MDRRRFLQLGLAASAAVVGSTGCMSLLSDARGVRDEADMDGFLAKLDRAMKAVGDGTPMRGLGRQEPTAGASECDAGGGQGDAQPAYSEGDLRLVQKSLRSLLLVGALHELPEPARHHPGLVARLNHAAPEMDEAVFGMTQLLAELSPGDRIELQRKLKREPELPMRVAEALDADAQALSVPIERRTRLRSLATHVAWRLRNQPPGALVDEYVTKVRKVAARSGYDEAVQRQIAASAASRSLVAWPMQSPIRPQVPSAGAPVPPPAGSAPAEPVPAAPTEPAPPGSGSEPVPAPTASTGGPVASPPPTAPPAPLPAPPPAGSSAVPSWPFGGGYTPETLPRFDPTPAECSDDAETGKAIMTAGGVLLGVGVLMGAVGAGVLAGGAIAGAALLTPGGILLLVGVVLLIVGGAVAAGDDLPPCPER